ncbi:glycoside hydrolase family 6 protein [Cellvibrio fibrivorans]|uniref:Glucanase n=1 Tax=Cellvibrio fibrivorans TaxID=126350 RepID=A0ABU1UUZ3_9GAMM|nr:glycoside hydrolase family 6 protein [Cellvibrio fibrivorans]MDR7088997.1 cellulose 1,4-beta-cellobiosidase [Cellvibrio fibrivorans]
MTTSLRKTYGLAALLSLGLAAVSQGAAAGCTYKITNEWNTGLTGEIIVTNSSTTAVNGWTVGWQYATNRVTSSWNVRLSGTNPYSASDMGWNGSLPPGQSVSFGFQVDKRGGAAEIPSVTGSICSGTVTSSSAPSSIPTTSSSRSSTPILSSSSSSVINNGGQQCNWYGTLYPLCVNTQSGWGWENNKSCISRSTCINVVGGSSSIAPSSSSRSSVIPSSSSVATTSSVAPSSRSSVAPSSSSVATTSSIAPSSRSSVAPSSSSVATTSSSVPSTSSSIAPSSRSSSSVSSVTPGVRLDNPFVDARWYVDPIWSAKAQAETNGSKIAGYSTAVWMDRIGAIAPTDGSYGLRDHLDAALAQNANVIKVVVYDLPNRDCHALASNGELKQTPEGSARYRTEYVDVIAGIFSDPKYASLRIIAIIEPDSLPNLVTNLSTPACQEATDPTHGYVANTRYTLSKLYPITNVYSYVDIGHSGWLGWTDNFGKAVTLIGNAIKGATGGVNSIAGFVSNTSGYTPLYEPFLDSLANGSFGTGGGTQTRQAKFYEWNPHFSEVSFVQAWRTAMIAAGFPSTIGMLVDTSRNGWGGPNRPTAVSTSTVLDTFIDQSRIDRRAHRGNWCNQAGGVGERPQTAPVAGIDAYVWVKPPGESDGAASKELSFDPQDPAKGFDRNCDPTYTNAAGTTTGSMANAPVAGRWFKEGFQVLINNAYPPLN